MAIDTLPATTAKTINWKVGTDRLALRMSGVYQLDMTDSAEVALFHELEPGGEFELRAAVAVVGCGISWQRDRSGDAVAVTAVKTLAVDSIYRGD